MRRDPKSNLNNDEKAVPVITSMLHETEEGATRKEVGAKTSKCPIINVKCGQIVSQALIDTGSVKSVIAEETYEELVRKNVEVLVLPTSNTKAVDAWGKKSHPITKQVMVEIKINGRSYDVICLVVKKLIYPFILGVDFLEEHGVIVNMEERRVDINGENAWEKEEVVVREEETEDEEEEREFEEIEMCYIGGEEEIVRKLREKVEENNNITVDQKRALLQMLIRVKTVFEKREKPVEGYQFRIEITDKTPFKAKNYPIPIAYRSQVQALIQQMLDDGIVRKAATAYTNPILIRLCLDA